MVTKQFVCDVAWTMNHNDDDDTLQLTQHKFKKWICRWKKHIELWACSCYMKYIYQTATLKFG